MPSTGEHIKKAKHNEEFADSFDKKKSPYLDWALTGIFYSAVHYIEAFLATKGIHPRSHAQRTTYIGLYITNDTVFDAHDDLKTNSEIARYHCKKIEEKELDKSKIKLDDIKQTFKKDLPQIG